MMFRLVSLIIILSAICPFDLCSQSGNPFEVYRDEVVKYDAAGKMIHKVDNIKNPFDIDPVPYLSEHKPSAFRIDPTAAPVLQAIDKLPFWALIISLFVLAVTINLKRKTFMNMYRAVANDNYLKLLQREENNGNSVFFYLLYLIFFINAALFMYLMTKEYGVAMQSMGIFYILGGVICVYGIRHLSLYVIGAVYPLKKETNLFSFLILILNVIVGIFLLVINAFIAFSSLDLTFIYIGIFCVVAFYIWRNIMGIFMMLGNRRIGLFHFFIYLCTCEIAPNLIIWKFVDNYLQF